MKLLLPKVTLPSASSLLPLMVGLLCAGLFLMAGLILIQPHLDPRPMQSANVAAVSAHGFKGLRAVLEAEGYETTLNRSESGPMPKKADLAIVTFDQDVAFYNELNEHFEAVPAPEEPAVSESASASESSAEAAERRRKEEAQREAEASASRSYADANSTSASAPAEAVDDKKEEHYVSPSAEKSNRLLYKPLARAVLVVAPKWQAESVKSRPRWARDAQLVPPLTIFNQLTLLSPVIAEPITREDVVTYRIKYKRLPYVLTRAPGAKPASYALSPADGQTVITKAYTSGQIRALQSLRGPNLTPLLIGPDGEVLLSKVEPLPGDKPFAGPVYLLSDPDLLNNHILSDPERVAGALSIIRAVGGEEAKSVVFDVTYNYLAHEQNMLYHVSRAPFVGIPLALLVLGLALMWSAFVRFGPAFDPTREAAHGRGAIVLADNAARIIAKAGREAKLAPAYAQVIRDQVLKTTGMTAHTLSAADDMAERLSVRYQTTEPYSTLLRDAQTVGGPMQLLSLARRLHEWKRQIAHPQLPKTET